MDFFKNVSINIRAVGPAAVLVTWLICITLLGLLGDGELAGRAMTFLGFSGAFLVGALGSRTTMG